MSVGCVASRKVVDLGILTGSRDNGEASFWQCDYGCRGQDAEICAEGEFEAAAEG
jgi:hypothetical protein